MTNNFIVTVSVLLLTSCSTTPNVQAQANLSNQGFEPKSHAQYSGSADRATPVQVLCLQIFTGNNITAQPCLEREVPGESGMLDKVVAP